MQVQTKSINGQMHLKIDGAVTVASVANLQHALDSYCNDHEQGRVDCSHVSEIDTAGAQLLLSVRRSYETVALDPPEDNQLLDWLGMAGLAQIFCPVLPYDSQLTTSCR